MEAKVWDWPVRVFHWLLVLLLIVLFVTGKTGGNWLEWHKLAGYTVLGLVAFRLLWGFVGSHHARFVNFVRGPGAVVAYAKGLVAGNGRRYLGHNPLGALSVLAILLAVGVQAVTGLFANDDVMLEGPYAEAVGKKMSDLLTRIHQINSNVLIALAVLHLLAVGYYVLVKKEPLVKAMITGAKPAEGEQPAVSYPAWLPILLAVAVGVGVYFIVKK